MNDLLKRIRGALGIGLTWAVGWTAIGALLALVLFVVGMDPPGFFSTITAIFGAAGFLSGNMFAGVLRLTEGRRSFDELSLRRVVAWGAVGGLLLGGLGVTLFGGPGLHFEAVVAGVTTFLGAGSAAATLAMARRAEGGGATDPELAEAEAQRLLGDSG